MFRSPSVTGKPEEIKEKVLRTYREFYSTIESTYVHGYRNMINKKQHTTYNLFELAVNELESYLEIKREEANKGSYNDNLEKEGRDLLLKIQFQPKGTSLHYKKEEDKFIFVECKMERNKFFEVSKPRILDFDVSGVCDKVFEICEGFKKDKGEILEVVSINKGRVVHCKSEVKYDSGSGAIRIDAVPNDYCLGQLPEMGEYLVPSWIYSQITRNAESIFDLMFSFKRRERIFIRNGSSYSEEELLSRSKGEKLYSEKATNCRTIVHIIDKIGNERHKWFWSCMDMLLNSDKDFTVKFIYRTFVEFGTEREKEGFYNFSKSCLHSDLESWKNILATKALDAPDMVYIMGEFKARKEPNSAEIYELCSKKIISELKTIPPLTFFSLYENHKEVYLAVLAKHKNRGVVSSNSLFSYNHEKAKEKLRFFDDMVTHNLLRNKKYWFEDLLNNLDKYKIEMMTDIVKTGIKEYTRKQDIDKFPLIYKEYFPESLI